MAEGRWNDATLEPMRGVGDPLADAAIAEVFAHEGAASVNAVMRHLVDNDDLIPASLPPALRRFLSDTEALPASADPALVEAGHDLFSRFGPQIVVALHCAALPSCYAAAKGAEMLFLTHGMSKHTHRRIIETAQFVLDVMAPGGLGPRGRGIRSTQKVRLLHAAIRHLLRAHPAYSADWGVPINQEDLAGTLMSFSIITLDALRGLGVGLTLAEEHAYLHAWNVVGHVLGVDDSLLPIDAADARALFAAIRRRHYLPSEAGRALTRALVDFMHGIIPGTMFDGFAQVLIRHLVGEDTAALLGVEGGDWTRALLVPLRALDGVTSVLGDHSTVLAHVSGIFSRRILEGLCWVERGGSRVQFRIPASLREQWSM